MASPICAGDKTFSMDFIGNFFFVSLSVNIQPARSSAIAKPQVHLHETGIIRITRHPQMVGQIIWCIAHTLWIGSSFMVVTSLGLILHHLFGVWHGDRRLYQRYGDAFLELKHRTSVIPFLAIAQGRQEFKWQEFARPAYVGVVITIILFRWLHPIAISASANIFW